MWETIAIIVTLGGLEFTLWLLDRHAAKQDHEMQQKQLEILDGILTELAIQNSEDTNTNASGEGESERRHETRRSVPDENTGGKAADRAQEHSVCN